MEQTKMMRELCGGEEPVFVKPELTSDFELLNLCKMELLNQQMKAGECLWWPPEKKDDCLRDMLSICGVEHTFIDFCLTHRAVIPLQRCHLATKSFLSFLEKNINMSLYAICEFERLSKWIVKQDEIEFSVRAKQAQKIEAKFFSEKFKTPYE